jgi:hypothetical protein
MFPGSQQWLSPQLSYFLRLAVISFGEQEAGSGEAVWFGTLIRPLSFSCASQKPARVAWME